MTKVNLDNFTKLIRSASALTESRFLLTGETLESSVNSLASLKDIFATVLQELKDENLARAVASLAWAAQRVAALGGAQATESARFKRLETVVEAIGGRIAQMNRSVKTIDSLAINSKIAAANIRGSGVDFMIFADEIAVTLRMTRTSLNSFTAELESVRTYIADAHARQAAFEKQQEDAVRLIPGRLMATVDAIPQHHRRVAQAGKEVQQKTEQTSQRIRSAIMALQTGDITRQRLEHVDYALTLVQNPPQGSFTGKEGRSPQAEQDAFALTTFRLQSAQLMDAAQDFERDVRQIAESLSNMAAEARALRDLGSSAYGGSGGGRTTFITQLEDQIGEALDLFARFGTAQAEVAGVGATVAKSAENLCGHLRTVQALEDDIRIMGLNTTFKCARIGNEGLALNVIAQELRSYANTFAKEADALMKEVGHLTTMTNALADIRQTDTAALADEVTQALKGSLSTFQGVGRILDDALANLERESACVVMLLEKTAADLGQADATGLSLRQVADDLAALSPAADGSCHEIPPGIEPLLDLMARGYTMASERIVHNRILGRADQGALQPPSADADAELEDIFF